MALVLSALAAAPAAAAITYLYDALGRLVAVIDDPGAANEVAIYRYDAVGNLLAIERQSASAISVAGFTPARGPVGTPVVVSGTGFSATPAQNTVTFNGTAAAVTAASATQLTAIVPAGATTGPIAVTSPAGSATSSAPFTVTSDGSAPTIATVAPSVGKAGTAVTITGTNFEPAPAANRIAFSLRPALATSATATQLGVSVPAGATSGPLTVQTPGGTATGGDFFVPPLGYAGADVAQTARLSIGGSSFSGTVPSGKVGVYVFDGTQGQQLSLGYENFSGGLVNSDVYVFRPDGVQIAWTYSDFFGRDIQLAALPATGTYTILVDPRGSEGGNFRLTLSQDLNAGVLAVGGAAGAANISRPGQRARFTFEGAAGQRLSFWVSGTGSQGWLTVYKPDGTAHQSGPLGPTNPSAGTLDLQPLPVTGTYTAIFDPDFARTTNLTTVQLGAETTATIAVDGASVPLSVTSAAQRVRVTFEGVAGQRLDLGLTGVTISELDVSVLKPDGTTLVNPVWVLGFQSPNAAIDFGPLPTTGTYTILVDPRYASTGAATLTLSTEVSAAITPNGGAVPVTIARAGQRALLTFAGTAGQRVSLRGTGNTLTNYVVTLWTPAWGYAGLFFDHTGTVGGAAFGGPLPLSATGTYGILVDPGAAYTGSITLTLYDVPPDLTGSLTLNGPALTLTFAAPGQVANVTFPATAGQGLSLRGTNSTVGCFSGVWLFKPDGWTPSWGNVCGATWTLTSTAATGTHTWKLDPAGANIGTIDLQVTNP